MNDFEDRMNAHPYKTGLGVLLKVGAIVVALLVVVTVIALGLGWFKGATGVVSFSHVRQEYRFGYEYDRSMRATAENVCTGERRQLAPSAIAAYEQTYHNTEAQYDAAMADAFRAKHVKPSDLPLIAPTLAERVRQVC